jgi:hypothetical protein
MYSGTFFASQRRDDVDGGVIARMRCRKRANGSDSERWRAAISAPKQRRIFHLTGN